MFNFHAVNTAEVNATSQAPAPPVLTINTAEDSNLLSWTSPYFTDFFAIYWSKKPFASSDERGVRTIIESVPSPADNAVEEVSYTHVIPASYSLSVLYYRVDAYNRNS